MRAFEQRCDEILSLLGEKKHLSPHDRAQIERLYRSLKEDLKHAAKHGTVSGKRQPLTRAEECFYNPAARRAAIDLRPATNSNPISSNWYGAVYEAQLEFSHWLHSLARCLPAD